jgi:hypothetical protein
MGDVGKIAHGKLSDEIRLSIPAMSLYFDPPKRTYIKSAKATDTAFYPIGASACLKEVSNDQAQVHSSQQEPTAQHGGGPGSLAAA